MLVVCWVNCFHQTVGIVFDVEPSRITCSSPPPSPPSHNSNRKGFVLSQSYHAHESKVACRSNTDGFYGHFITKKCSSNIKCSTVRCPTCRQTQVSHKAIKYKMFHKIKYKKSHTKLSNNTCRQIQVSHKSYQIQDVPQNQIQDVPQNQIEVSHKIKYKCPRKLSNTTCRQIQVPHKAIKYKISHKATKYKMSHSSGKYKQSYYPMDCSLQTRLSTHTATMDQERLHQSLDSISTHTQQRIKRDTIGLQTVSPHTQQQRIKRDAISLQTASQGLQIQRVKQDTVRLLSVSPLPQQSKKFTVSLQPACPQKTCWPASAAVPIP